LGAGHNKPGIGHDETIACIFRTAIQSIVFVAVFSLASLNLNYSSVIIHNVALILSLCHSVCACLYYYLY